MPSQPTLVRAAAALAWAWLIQPQPLPEPAATALRDTSAPEVDAFGKLPWEGVYHRGLWSLPVNAGDVIVRLAENQDKDLRWRAVQGLALERETGKRLTAAQVVPVLLERLADDYNRIRAAAAQALAQRGEAILKIAPNAIPTLIGALERHQSRDWADRFSSLDSDASIAGHAAGLLVTVAHRLTPAQRKATLTGIKRAMRRYAGRKQEYVSFHSTGIQADAFFRRQHDLLVKPPEWTPAALFVEFAFPDKAARRLSPQAVDRRLADAYGRAPQQTIAAAIGAVRRANDRNAAIGAAHWLMTIGPAAAAALEALDNMASGSLDAYARTEAAAASRYIRQALLVPRDQVGQSASNQIPRDMVALEQSLDDDAFSEVGIVGEYECKGRLYHWRRERRSARADAIRTLLALGRIPPDQRMMQAMLAEASQASVICSKAAIAQHFSMEQWRSAVDAAGGFSLVEPMMRGTQQQCHREPWPGHDGPYICADELAQVIRRLDGRLV